MGLLSFVGDAFNDIFGGNSSRKDAQRYNVQNMAIQQKYAERNMALQNEYNIEAFNRENEYNSPVAQKMRNYQAGINPNWQDGSSVVAQQDSGVNVSSPSGGMPSGSNVGSIGDILSMVKLGSEMKNLNADTEKKNKEGNAAILGAEASQRQAEAAEETAKANVKNSLNQEKLVPSQVFKNTMDGLLSFAKNITERKLRDANVAEIISRVTKNLKDAEVSDATRRRIEALLTPELNKLIADTANTVANTAKQKSETYRNYEETKQQWQQLMINAKNAETNRQSMLIHGKEVDELIRNNKWNNMVASGALKIQQQIADGQVEYWASGTKFINAQTIYQEIENKFRRYLRANHLDAEQVEVFLNNMRAQTRELDTKAFLNQQQADNYEFEMIGRFVSGLGVNWNQLPTQKPVYGPVTTTPQGTPFQFNSTISY